jgi:hypothetical protein
MREGGISPMGGGIQEMQGGMPKSTLIEGGPGARMGVSEAMITGKFMWQFFDVPRLSCITAGQGPVGSDRLSHYLGVT